MSWIEKKGRFGPFFYDLCTSSKQLSVPRGKRVLRSRYTLRFALRMVQLIVLAMLVWSVDAHPGFCAWPLLRTRITF
jgi:hypothetical protein